MREKTRKPRPKKNNIPIKSTAEAIGDIENALGNEPVVIYIADRNIGPWDVLPMFTQLSNKFSNTGKVSNLNLILDSGGGFPDDAYKIADVIHEFCDTLTVIVPLKAKSAATLLSLAGKKILMGPISELGPCDPMIGVDESLLTPSGIPVRPIGDEESRTKKKTKQMNALALRDFLEAAGILIRDGEGKITGYHCEKLVPFFEKGVLNPWLLGDFERSFKQACQFAENLLRRYMFKDDPGKLKLVPEITHKLTEGYYYHGYPISRREAQEMGLNVIDMPQTLWEQTSELMSAYDDMKREQNICTIIETSASYHIDKWLH